MREMTDLEFGEQMKGRTKAFALRIIRMFRALPRSAEARAIGEQILRSGTSVGANYRAVCRARSLREFVAKMGVVLEEADETSFWMELLAEAEIVSPKRMGSLSQEACELVRIFSATCSTARRNIAKKRKTLKLSNSQTL